MSTELLIHKLVFEYDKYTLLKIKSNKIPQDSLKSAMITDIPGFEQRCTIMAWHLAYQEYCSTSDDKSYSSFITNCVGTIDGLKLYSKAFDEIHSILDKDLTIAKLIEFQAS
jgi:hypothetical protein